MMNRIARLLNYITGPRITYSVHECLDYTDYRDLYSIVWVVTQKIITLNCTEYRRYYFATESEAYQFVLTERRKEQINAKSK